MGSILIYGANGYTGELAARRARELGLPAVLAGRNAEALDALGQALGLPVRVFGLDDADALKHGLRQIAVVLHCAGPFSATAQPMIAACLQTGAHYLDITGEIDVYAYAHSCDAAAKKRGIVLCPGVGFDVVPTDCLAALLKAALPDATQLTLAFEAGGGPSPGTAKSSVEGAAKGGRIRRGGKLVRVPQAWKIREIPFARGPRKAVTIPWGDVYTAYVSTGIPDIEVYMALPPKAIRNLQRMRRLSPLLGFPFVQTLLKALVERKVRGPDPIKRESTQSQVWGEAVNALGEKVVGEVVTPNGYTLTAEASIEIARRVLQQPPAGGYYTPSQLVGPEILQALPGVEVRPPRRTP
ncbi:MAG: saccharopine dehydrogenase NADP-binding domain-containing protein [Xanthomonadales bacterium]|jgi:short subunit dehydrogenase-like uncharacterized protein|nr:saccharopine dehydrogenase NADP-binding domain-containing protein [Xanthomonadales bacterium]